MLGLALEWVRPLFDGQGPTIEGPPPPPPPPLPPGLATVVVVLTAFAMLCGMLRWASRRFGVGARHAARIGLLSGAIGNALMDLAAVMQPDRPRMEEIQQLRQTAVRPEEGRTRPRGQRTGS